MNFLDSPGDEGLRALLASEPPRSEVRGLEAHLQGCTDRKLKVRPFAALALVASMGRRSAASSSRALGWERMDRRHQRF